MISSAIQNRVLSCESISYPNSRVIILDEKDKDKKDILVALHLDINKNNITVSELSSVYGKRELGYLLENTIKLNKEIEITDKTNEWLLSNKVQFPALVTTHLLHNINISKCQAEYKSNPLPADDLKDYMKNICQSDQATRGNTISSRSGGGR